MNEQCWHSHHVVILYFTSVCGLGRKRWINRYISATWLVLFDYLASFSAIFISSFFSLKSSYPATQHTMPPSFKIILLISFSFASAVTSACRSSIIKEFHVSRRRRSHRQKIILMIFSSLLGNERVQCGRNSADWVFTIAISKLENTCFCLRASFQQRFEKGVGYRSQFWIWEATEQGPFNRVSSLDGLWLIVFRNKSTNPQR